MAKIQNKLFEEFEKLEDPRIDRRKLHKLEDIIIIVLFAVISGCNEWQEIELYGKTKIDFLKNFCELKNGIPSHDTLERLFNRLDPKKFKSSRKIKGKEEKERRYYISSLEGESEAFLWTTRSHWGLRTLFIGAWM